MPAKTRYWAPGRTMAPARSDVHEVLADGLSQLASDLQA